MTKIKHAWYVYPDKDQWMRKKDKFISDFNKIKLVISCFSTENFPNRIRLSDKNQSSVSVTWSICRNIAILCLMELCWWWECMKTNTSYMLILAHYVRYNKHHWHLSLSSLQTQTHFLKQTITYRPKTQLKQTKNSNNKFEIDILPFLASISMDHIQEVEVPHWPHAMSPFLKSWKLACNLILCQLSLLTSATQQWRIKPLIRDKFVFFF